MEDKRKENEDSFKILKYATSGKDLNIKPLVVITGISGYLGS